MQETAEERSQSRQPLCVLYIEPLEFPLRLIIE